VSETAKRNRDTIQAPYGRVIRLDEVDFESGMRLLRVTIREGGRFTILDLDAPTAAQWGRSMCDWAQGAAASPTPGAG
jgi:hypothetical protein